MEKFLYIEHCDGDQSPYDIEIDNETGTIVMTRSNTPPWTDNVQGEFVALADYSSDITKIRVGEKTIELDPCELHEMFIIMTGLFRDTGQRFIPTIERYQLKED